MKNLSIFQRLVLIIVLVAVSFCVISSVQIWSVRQTIVQERQDKLRDMVGSVIKLTKFYADKAASGELPLDKAQEAAKEAIRAMRWGEGDYYGVYRFDGMTLVHGNPKNEGINRLNLTDSAGHRVVADMIEIAQHGGGFLEPLIPRAAGGKALPKITYQAAFEPWQWAVQAGTYTDDIDAAMYRQALWSGGSALVALLLVAGIASLVARGITSPLAALCGVMDHFAGGQLTENVPFTDRRTEIGQIARTLEVFKAGMIESECLRSEQETIRQEADAASHRTRQALADAFEASISDVVTAVSAAASQMRMAAQSMSATARQTAEQSMTVSAAAEQASANVQTVASANEELSSSVAEISRQMAYSANITGKTMDDAQRTNAIVESLAAAAQKIGEVVSLINGIASQTNLLALNASIEAARAGDAGKGFNVVAGEVKALAAQTSNATQEIAEQIAAIQEATRAAVTAIKGIGGTITELNGIATAIAAGMEEQGAAMQEITRNTQEAARGVTDVTANIGDICRNVEATGVEASDVVKAAGDLERRAAALGIEADKFVTSIRTA
jgi:methyl-accepting chemotaxis protein